MYECVENSKHTNKYDQKVILNLIFQYTETG